MRGAVALGLAVLAAGPSARSGEGGVWGTRPGEVMVAVFAQFSEDSDERLWHLPLGAASAHDARTLRLDLRGGPRLYLPVGPDEDARAVLDRVRGARGELLRLEFHPAVSTPRGKVHASWTLTPRREIAGQGHVPITNRLYSAMLKVVGDDVPDTGVFAPLAAAQRRLDLLVRNVTEGNGREVDELAEDFLAAVAEAGLPLEFYRLPDGRHASEDAIAGIRDRGHVLSAVDYWNAALSKFRQNRIVNPTLSEFETAWAICPADTQVRVEFPGARGRRVLSDRTLRDFRRLAAQKYLDAALSAARGRDPDWTMEMLRRFREERDASGLELGEFRIEGRTVGPDDLERLVKLARRETGLLGFFRAIWHRILEASLPRAQPA